MAAPPLVTVNLAVPSGEQTPLTDRLDLSQAGVFVPLVGVAVGVAVKVAVAVLVGDGVKVAVSVGVGVYVAVSVGVETAVAVLVAVRVRTGVEVGPEQVASAWGRLEPGCPAN